MTHPPASERVLGIVRDTVGAVFANPVREPLVTCEVCSTPTDGYQRCFPCHSRVSAGLASRVGVVAYAVRGEQSGYLMRTYKAPGASSSVQAPVAVLLATAFRLHSACLTAIAGRPPDFWVAVPSLPARPGEHALHELLRRRSDLPGAELRVEAAAAAAAPRDVDAHHFLVVDDVPAGSHVLVIDDTWTTGGHAQSMAAALFEAGADQVSVLVLARWIEPSFGANQAFLEERIVGAEFDPMSCPWGCP